MNKTKKGIWISLLELNNQLKMHQIKGECINRMPDDEKLQVAWTEIKEAVNNGDIKRVMNLAFWIKALQRKLKIDY